jgi:hypothetical protein
MRQVPHSTSTGAVLANDKLPSALQENRLDVDPNGRAHTMLSLGKQMPSYITPNYVTPTQDLMTHRSSICCNTQCIGITQLLVVKTSIDMHIAQGNTPIEYPQYYALLLSACSTYDEANGLKNGPTEVTLRHSTHRINEKSTPLKVTPLSMKPSSPSSTSKPDPHD